MRNQAARCRMCADRRSGTQRAHPGDLRGNTTSSILFGLASGAHLLPGGDVACADPVVVGGVQVQSAFFVDSHRPPHPCLWGADVGDAFESDLPASVGRDGLFAYFAHIFHLLETTLLSAVLRVPRSAARKFYAGREVPGLGLPRHRKSSPLSRPLRHHQTARFEGEMSLTAGDGMATDRKSTRLNSSHLGISYAV